MDYCRVIRNGVNTYYECHCGHSYYSRSSYNAHSKRCLLQAGGDTNSINEDVGSISEKSTSSTACM